MKKNKLTVFISKFKVLFHQQPENAETAIMFRLTKVTGCKNKSAGPFRFMSLVAGSKCRIVESVRVGKPYRVLKRAPLPAHRQTRCLISLQSVRKPRLVCKIIHYTLNYLPQNKPINNCSLCNSFIFL
jgi:hypothetical protein